MEKETQIIAKYKSKPAEKDVVPAWLKYKRELVKAGVKLDKCRSEEIAKRQPI